MKHNINDAANLSEIKKLLTTGNASAIAINSIERAVKNGMVFKTEADLSALNLSVADLGIIKDAVVFGNAAPAANTVKTFQFSFVPLGNKKSFFGYQFLLTYTDASAFTIAETFPIEDSSIVLVDLDMANILPGSKIVFQVKTAVGELTELILGNAGEPKETRVEVDKNNLASAVVRLNVKELGTIPNPDVNKSYQVKGKLISNAEGRLQDYQIVIEAAVEKTGDVPSFFPVAFANTETNGYFVSSFLVFNVAEDIERVLAARAIISNENKSWDKNISLITEAVAGSEFKKSFIPPRVILSIDEEGQEDNKDCGCGCSDLNFHEKKVLEEYSYFTVVRTTEPSIIADILEDEEEIDLDEIFGTGGKVPITVFRNYQASINTLVKPVSSKLLVAGNASAATSSEVSTLAAVNPAIRLNFNADLLKKVLVDSKISAALKGKNKRQFKGRTLLNPLNQIDWDDEPTIYQAASIAHGHLLQFKQEWLPDGYSIGDILYSLPLAPGQKKQIAVLDWERRESAANSQQLDYEETLNNSLVRDRDINEVINATLNENIKGSSTASTGGFAAGIGGGVLGVFSGGAFGALFGVSGGKSSSSSSASQNSHRDSTASSMQSISDKTVQAASAVRSQRATVIQTVSQGEKVQATAESVANYNHCHAITIQYFEVLRHFSIQTRLASVQECLFVPLQMSPFDLEKIIRWRTTLEKRIFNKQLRSGFAASARLLHEKENTDNYYDSIGYPKVNYAEFPMIAYTGELLLQFNFFNTSDRVDDALINFFRIFNISIDEFRDRLLRDSELADVIGPRAIEFILNSIVIETDKGVDLKFDLSMLSRFRQNALMHISIRQSAQTPTGIRRDRVDAIKIRIDQSKLNADQISNIGQLTNKYMKIRIQSGSLRYRMKNFSGILFNGRIDNDLFADADAVFISTLPGADELRNPRGEDIDAANNLIQHLNENLEYYHKCIWFDMTPERRYMLLDGILAPGKANGRSVASVVENKLIGIAGNCLVMPVAPGNQLDPTIDEKFDLFAQYYNEEKDPIRISMPTKGVYAESVIGKCNACEEKDESRFWRWEESPIPDSPNTQILPINTDTRRADPGNLQAKDFPNPVVNIQNAPNVPDPTGLQGMLQLIGKGDSFRDITGLSQNQTNALATFQKSMDTAQAFGKEAADLAKTAAQMKMVQDAKNNGTISKDDAKEKGNQILDKSQKDASANKLQDGINLMDKLQKEGKITPEKSTEAKNNLLKKFLDSSNANTPMTNAEIQKLLDALRGTDKNLSVKRPDGETVEVNTSGGGGSSSSMNFTIPGEIPLVQQPTGNTCWAATTAMMVSWKRQLSVSIEDAVSIAGTAPDGETYLNKFNTDKILLSVHQADYNSKQGLSAEAPANYLPIGILQLLQAFGPLWVANDEDNGHNPNLYHYRIIIGIHGDGSNDGTFLKIIDPATGTVNTERFSVFQAKYEQIAIEDNNIGRSSTIQIIHF